MFKLGIGFCNCVRADHQFFRESANARKSIAIAENARFNGMPNLLDYLRVERLTCRWIEPKNHHRKAVSQI